jgi:DNA invertase Pin-like site-specific DNA recombinase
VIIGYARVSTADQNLDRQRKELADAGCEQIRAETGSGKRGAVRPVWDETFRHLRKGDTLVVTELSRLGRSSATLGALADELQERGVALRVLNLGGGVVDTASASGRLLFDILAAVAQMERALLIERVQSGLAAAKARDTHLGRPAKLSADQVKAAQAMRQTGTMSMREIAAQLRVSRNTLYRSLNAADRASTERAAS